MYREEMLIILLLAVIAYLTWIGLELRHQRKSAGKAHYEFPQSGILQTAEPIMFVGDKRLVNGVWVDRNADDAELEQLRRKINSNKGEE